MEKPDNIWMQVSAGGEPTFLSPSPVLCCEWLWSREGLSGLKEVANDWVISIQKHVKVFSKAAK